MPTAIGLCTIDLYLPDVHSLKEKRGILRSMQARLRKQFNIAIAEVDYQDKWQSAQIAVTSVGNSNQIVHKILMRVIEWIEDNFPDVIISGERIEML